MRRSRKLFSKMAQIGNQHGVDVKKLHRVYETNTAAGLPPFSFAVKLPGASTWLVGMYATRVLEQNRWLKTVTVYDSWESKVRKTAPAVKKSDFIARVDGHPELIDLIERRMSYYQHRNLPGRGHDGVSPITSAVSQQILDEYIRIKRETPDLTTARIAERLGITYSKLYSILAHYQRYVNKHLDNTEKV